MNNDYWLTRFHALAHIIFYAIFGSGEDEIILPTYRNYWEAVVQVID